MSFSYTGLIYDSKKVNIGLGLIKCMKKKPLLLYTGNAQYGHPHCAKSADGSGVSISGHQHLCW